MCEGKGKQCGIKTDATDEESLIVFTKTDSLANIKANILKKEGAQTINQKLKLNAGFKATSLEVTNGCSLDEISCDNLALDNVPQTWNGDNNVNGDVSMVEGKGLSVSN